MCGQFRAPAPAELFFFDQLLSFRALSMRLLALTPDCRPPLRHCFLAWEAHGWSLQSFGVAKCVLITVSDSD